MITGVHVIVFAPEAERARAFFRDVLALESVDAGGGWPIFALPPAELGIHPDGGPTRHELYLLCDDIAATVDTLRGRGVEFTEEVHEERWGLVTALRLPDGSELAVYQPRHPTAHPLGG
jgi:catechol 2,3-dioxygenase-like lactoylglutathione lyase family enzyme